MNLNTIMILSVAFAAAMTAMYVWASNRSATPEKSEKDVEDYAGLYQRRCLLTANEKSQYDRLQSTAVKLRLSLFTKVRLADIVEPVNGIKNWKTLFNKIRSKHVDFLMCDRNMKPVCVIEIDDSSHDKDDRKQRDKFVDFILKDVGIPTIRKRGIIGTELENEIAQLTKSVSFTAR